MSNSPFIYMACSLTMQPIGNWISKADVPEPGLSRTERIRRLLKASSRPVTAHEITWDMADHFPNFGSHLVWLLLKYDIQKGRVILVDGKYSWNHDYDRAESRAIRDALSLLKKHGYKVKGPQA